MLDELVEELERCSRGLDAAGHQKLPLLPRGRPEPLLCAPYRGPVLLLL